MGDKENLVRQRYRREQAAEEAAQAKKKVEQERAEAKERQQLLADLEPLAATAAKIIESWDWSQADIWTFVLKKRTWWRWFGLTEERAMFRLSGYRALGDLYISSDDMVYLRDGELLIASSASTRWRIDSYDRRLTRLWGEPDNAHLEIFCQELRGFIDKEL